MITEHPSLCIRSGDLTCCNCLRKYKLNPEIAFVDTHGASSISQAVLSSSPSQEGAGPSSQGSSSSNQGAGPSSQGAGPSSQGSGPSSQGSSSSNQGAGPSSQGAGPSSQGSSSSNHGAGPSSQGSGPSSPSKEVVLNSPSQQCAGPSSPSQEGAGPSSPSQEGAGPSTIGSAPSTMLNTPIETEDSDIDEQLELLKANETLVLHGISPARKRTMRSNKALAKKLMRLDNMVQRNLVLAAGASSDVLIRDDGAAMIEQLRDKFASSTSRSEKLTILTVLPKSWSIAKIVNVFGVTKCMARCAKKLVEVKGIMSNSIAKAGKSLSESTVQLVKTFYCHDDISRVMPGTKDFLSVRNESREKEHRQKRLVLCNLTEAYRQCIPDIKVGFSKFAELRPKECVLAGATGTHSVCVCIMHQNVKLIMTGGRLEALTKGWYNHYTDCLAAMQCEPPTYKCVTGKCKHCPEIEQLREELETTMEENGVETVQYNKWVSTDRANLETCVLSVQEFLLLHCRNCNCMTLLLRIKLPF